MLQLSPRLSSFLFRIDPGALRLLLGTHATLTTVAAALLAEQLARFQSDISSAKLGATAAAAGAFCLYFTPVSTRKRETVVIFRHGIVLLALFGVGALASELASKLAAELGAELAGGKAVATVLQALWVVVLAIGLALFGVGSYWPKAGRMIAMIWMFVITVNLPDPAGLWAPAMAVFGVLVAFVIRIGSWRPSLQATFRRVDRETRRAIAEYLRLLTDETPPDEARARADVSRIRGWRAQLRISAVLAAQEGDVTGLLPEAAAMMQLALQVVHDALSQMSPGARNRLCGDESYRRTVRRLAGALESGSVPDGEVFETGWVERDGGLSRDDRFHTLRVAQAFKRLRQLAGQGGTLPAASGQKTDSGTSPLWRRLSWRLSLQGAVAGSIGLALGLGFDMNHAYWVTLTVAVVLCSSLGSTVQKSLRRTVGTATGILIAMAVDPLLSGFPEIRLTLAALALPLFIVFVERNYAVAAGCITFMVVLGSQTLEHVPIEQLWSRLYDTVLGAGIGLTVAWLLFPIRTDARIRSQTSAFLASCAGYLGVSGRADGEESREYLRLRKAAADLVASARGYRAEQAPWSSFTGAGNGLDVEVFLLVDYTVLYRQARAAVMAEAQKQSANLEIPSIAARLDERIQNEFGAILKGEGRQSGPGLVEAWLAAMPEDALKDTGLMMDWVAMLYYARKVLQCLDSLMQDNMWSKAAATAQPVFEKAG